MPTALAVPASVIADAPRASDAPSLAGTQAGTDPTSERIDVVAHSLSGLWKVSSPKRLAMEIGLFSGVRISYSVDVGDRDICALRQSGTRLDAHCLRSVGVADGEIRGDQVTLNAWLGPALLILRAATPEAGVLEGSVGAGALGVRLTGGVPIRATRLALMPPTAERASAPVLRSVLADITDGHLTAGRYAPEAAHRLGRVLSTLGAALGKQGAIIDVVFLDALLPRHPYDPNEQPLEVYRVDYAAGNALCGVSLDPAGTVTDFICGS